MAVGWMAPPPASRSVNTPAAAAPGCNALENVNSSVFVLVLMTECSAMVADTSRGGDTSGTSCSTTGAVVVTLPLVSVARTCKPAAEPPFAAMVGSATDRLNG